MSNPTTPEMPEHLTAEQVLEEVDIFCSAHGTSVLAPHMRTHWEKTGKMPLAVLTSLKLRPVTMFVRVRK